MPQPSSGGALPPFWQRLREISLYPFRSAALVTMIVLILIGLLGFLPGIGWLFSLIAWLASYKFGFEILRATADGRMEPPEVVLGVDDSVVWKFIGLQILFIAIFLIVAGIGGLPLALIALVLIAFMQPGCIISLAIDGNFGNAINPATAISIMTRIGWPYLAAFGLLFVIQVSAATAGGWVEEHMPIIVGDVLLSAFNLWGTFATFHLMGYLVFQYHDELGYEPSTERDALPTLQTRDSSLLQQAEEHVREGRTEAALALLRDEMRERAVTLPTHELYRRLLRQQGDPAALREHARLYLNLLMMEKPDRRALGLLRESLDLDPNFVPMQAEHAEQLAERARLAGQSQLALDTLMALLRAFPKSPEAPRHAFAAAMLMSERLGRDADARQLLEQARTRCEDPDLRQKIDAALSAIGPAA